MSARDVFTPPFVPPFVDDYFREAGRVVVASSVRGVRLTTVGDPVLGLGGTVGLRVAFSGSGPFSREVIWGSSNPGVAVVVDGVVHGVGLGLASVWVESVQDARQDQVMIMVVDAAYRDGLSLDFGSESALFYNPVW